MNNWQIMAPYAHVGFKPHPGVEVFQVELAKIPGVKPRGAGWNVPGNAVKVVAALAELHGVQLAFAKWQVRPPPETSWAEVESLLREGKEVRSFVLDGFLTEYQKDAVAFGWTRAGVHYWHSTGCLAGDTLLTVNRAGKSFQTTLSKLVHSFNGGESGRWGKGYRWDPAIPTRVQCLKGGYILLNEVEAAFPTGEKEVFRLHTRGGRAVEATAEHRFLAPEGGWKELKDLKEGDTLVVRGGKNAAINAEEDVVESIERLGLKPTFDLTMKSPHNNYVANGFVVHNSGKTLTGLLASLAAPGGVIVVTRASARLQFAREIERFTYIKPYVIRPEGERRGLMTVQGETWVDFFKKRMPKLGKAALVAEEWKAAKAKHGVLVKKGSSLKDYLDECSAHCRRAVVIVGWEALVTHLPVLKKSAAGALLVDECFPGSQKVRTREGERPIKEIEVGDEVLSRSQPGGQLEWKGVLRSIKSSGSGRLLIRVSHEEGGFICTPNHEVWTLEEGYVQAGLLRAHHHLLPLRGGLPAETESGQAESEVLLSKLWRGSPSGGEAAGGGEAQVCLVPQGVRGSSSSHEEVLWALLLRQVEGPDGAGLGGLQAWGEGGTGFPARVRGEPPFSAGSHRGFSEEDERVQSHARPLYKGEGESDLESDGALSQSEGRERYWLDGVRGSGGGRDGAPPLYGAGAPQSPFSVLPPSSVPLQGGSGGPPPQAGGGDRRGVSQLPLPPGPGQEEGCSASGSRVFGVEVHEPAGSGGLGGSGEEDHLYDLEVEGNHNYFVEGVLVSNCHQGKGSKRWEVLPISEPDGSVEQIAKAFREQEREAKKKGGFVKQTEEGRKMFLPVLNRASAAADLARCVSKRVGTTATPIQDRVRDLWSQLDIVEPNSWGNKTTWENRHANRKPGIYGGYDTTGASNLEELNLRLGPVAHVLTYAETHAHLPPKRRQSVYVAPEDQCRPAGGFAKERKDAAKRGATALLEVSLAEAASRKRTAVIGIVEDHVRSGQKVVCFTGRRRDCEKLGKSVSSCSAVKKGNIKVWAAHGGQSQKVRDQIVQDYMAYRGSCVLVGTMQAFGESINIDDTDAALFVMIPYTPGVLRQAEGRFHRASTKRPVIIYYIIAEGTVDEHMAAILIDKLPAVEKVARDTELGEAKDVLAGLDPNESDEDFAASVLADLDFT